MINRFPMVVKKEVLKEYEKATFSEFLKISRWVFSLFYSIDPLYVTIYIVSTIIFSFDFLVNTYVISQILDKAIEVVQSDARIELLYPYIGILLLVNLLLNVLGFFYSYARRSLHIKSRPKIRKLLYEKMHSLGVQTLENPEITNKIYRADREMYGIINYFEEIVRLLEYSVSLVASLLFIAGFAPLVIPILFFVAIPRFLHDKKHRRLAWKFGYENTECSRKANANARKLTNPIPLKEVIVGGALRFLSTRFTKFTNWHTKEQIKIRRRWNLSGRIYSFFDDVGIAIGYLIIFSQFILKKISVGDVYFQIRIVDRLSRDINRVTQALNQTFEFTVRIKDAYLLFQLTPAVKDGTIKLQKLHQAPKVEVNNLSFKYPRSENYVIENLNLSIKKGEKVAVVGHNGAGKTTLVKLVCRMYIPSRGCIKINENKLQDITAASWYPNIGVLFQDYNTYGHLSVRENIAIGDPNVAVDENRLINAAKNADIIDFVNEYPNKFDQILSERFEGGIRPSSGQWQKIAIARFFYRNAPLVIFDEPTAAIDAVSEYKIFNKIYSFFKGKTVIIVSHRFSTVRNADRIIVLEKGEIIEEGSHEELMQKDGYYAKSFRLQAEGYSK